MGSRDCREGFAAGCVDQRWALCGLCGCEPELVEIDSCTSGQNQRCVQGMGHGPSKRDCCSSFLMWPPGASHGPGAFPELVATVVVGAKVRNGMGGFGVEVRDICVSAVKADNEKERVFTFWT